MSDYEHEHHHNITATAEKALAVGAGVVAADQLIKATTHHDSHNKAHLGKAAVAGLVGFGALGLANHEETKHLHPPQPNQHPPYPDVDSSEYLKDLFQQAFNQRQAARKERFPETEAMFRPFRQLLKDDPDIAKAREIARKRCADYGQKPDITKAGLVHQIIQPRNVGSGVGSGLWYRTPPFDKNYKFHNTYGSATYSVSADSASGDILENTFSSDDGGFGFVEAGVGIVFKPTASGMLNIASNPSIFYYGGCGSFLDSVHTHGSIGFWVIRCNLSGPPLYERIVDQEISLWDLSSDDSFSGSSLGFPLSASFPVDDSHFYQIWVRVSESSEGDGWGFFNWSFARGTLEVHVPWILGYMF